MLRKKIGIEIDTKSVIALDVFKKIFEELWNKNIDGDWMKIFNSYDKLDFNRFILPNINKKGWQFAFKVMANNDKEILKNFNNLSKFLNYTKEINIPLFKKEIITLFGRKWMYDIEDLAYFYETLGFIILKKEEDYTLSSLKVIKKIPKIKNFNEEIIYQFSEKNILENEILENNIF